MANSVGAERWCYVRGETDAHLLQKSIADFRRRKNEERVDFSVDATLEDGLRLALHVNASSQTHVLLEQTKDQRVPMIVEERQHVVICDAKIPFCRSVHGKVENITSPHLSHHLLPCVFPPVESEVFSVHKYTKVREDCHIVAFRPLLIVSQFYLDHFELVIPLSHDIGHSTPGRSEILAVTAPLVVNRAARTNGSIPMNENERVRSQIICQLFFLDIYNMLILYTP